jgi:DNA primase
MIGTSARSAPCWTGLGENRKAVAFPPGFLDELRSRLSLSDLVGRRVRLVRRGREYSGLCPFHNEKTPSFYVVEDKGFFHCFGCGAHGDAIGFLMRADNLDFIEAVERLAGEAGLAVPQQTPQEREQALRQKTLLEALAAAADFYEKQLWGPGGARARDYLARRGLDAETMHRFHLGWAPDDRQALRRALAGEFPEALLREAGLLRVPETGGLPYDHFRGRIMFPIGDRAGRTIAFGGRTLGDDQPKYLNSPDTPVFEKGRVLYGHSAARANVGSFDDPAAAPIIVVEGYMDVIALHRAGFGTAVAPLGTALTEAHLEELWRLGPEPVICLDNDRPGAFAAHRVLNRAVPILKPGRSLRFLVLPEGEDPDSLVRASGPGEFSARLARARPLSQFWWDEELRLWPNDTPERRADLERRVMLWVDKINDRVVQAEYRRFFRERLFQLGRRRRPMPQPRGRPAGSNFNVRPDFALDFAPPPPPPPGRRNREFLLATLIHKAPWLIDEMVEEIAALDIPEPELDRLRGALLEVSNAHPGLDAEAFRQHLAFCGHTEIVGALAITIAKHAGFAVRGGNDPDVIKRGLRETLRLLQARESSEVSVAGAAFAADPSAENAQRLLLLKEREFHDGPIGGSE